MKIYIITSGSYSDYSIDTVFLDKELAEEYVDKHNNCGDEYYHDDTVIEEYSIEENLDKYVYNVSMKRDGGVVHCHYSEHSHKDFYYEGNKGYEGMYVFYTKSRDKKRAIKIANERRTQLIAENKWGVKEGK